jgi:chromosome segregation ATPase
MIQEQEFDRLEQFVKRLLTQFNQLREENTRLESQLGKRDTEIAELKTELFTADSAKGDITARVKGLIEQIEDWESTLDETEMVTETEIALETEIEAEAKAEVVSDQVAAVGDPVDEIEDEEKDGGQQQSLFNVEPSTTNMGG